MEDVYFKAVCTTVQANLCSGSRIAVLGWKPKQHSEFTRRVSETGRVLFFNEIPKSLPTTVKLALTMRAIGHSERARINHHTTVQKGLHRPQDIKMILESCKGILFPQEQKPVFAVLKHQTPTVPFIRAELVEESIPKPMHVPLEVFMDNPHEVFGNMFREEASKHPKLLVGKMSLSQIRAKSGVPSSTAQLVRQGYIESIVGDGMTKAGWYKAGPKLVQAPLEPTDPVGKARVLISQEESLQEERQRLLEQTQVIDAKLELIRRAREQLSALESLFA